MDNTLEHIDAAWEGFALVLESLEAAGVSLQADAYGDADTDEVP